MLTDYFSASSLSPAFSASFSSFSSSSSFLSSAFSALLLHLYLLLLLCCIFCFFFLPLLLLPLDQMRQQAAVGGQQRPSLPNGPVAEHPHPHQAGGVSCSSPLNHAAGQAPCPAAPQPTANGSCSSSPSTGLLGHLDKNHTLGLGGGGASNGNVPYPQQNSLPHNCTAASHPSTSSTTSSPSHTDETWRSQQRNTTTQVPQRRYLLLLYRLSKIDHRL